MKRTVLFAVESQPKPRGRWVADTTLYMSEKRAEAAARAMTAHKVRVVVSSRSWRVLKALRVLVLRCGRHKGNRTMTGKGCSLPQGHHGKCDFTVPSYEEKAIAYDAAKAKASS